MDGWLVTLSRTPTPHVAMPELNDVLDHPTDADKRTLLPLLRLHLESIDGTSDQWPEWAPLVGYTIQDDTALTHEWPMFALCDSGRLTHDMPEFAFFEDPVLREADLLIIRGSRGEPETVERFWRIHELSDTVARRSGRHLTHADIDQLLALPPGEAKRVMTEYPAQRLALSSWLAVEPTQLPDDALERESVWDAWVRRGVVVGLLLDQPIGLPAPAAWPTAADGTPLQFVGQFKAGNITAYGPAAVYWLFWSPSAAAFVQVDASD